MSLFNDIKPESFSNISQLLRPKPKKNILAKDVTRNKPSPAPFPEVQTEANERSTDKNALAKKSMDNNTPADMSYDDNAPAIMSADISTHAILSNDNIAPSNSSASESKHLSINPNSGPLPNNLKKPSILSKNRLGSKNDVISDTDKAGNSNRRCEDSRKNEKLTSEDTLCEVADNQKVVSQQDPYTAIKSKDNIAPAYMSADIPAPAVMSVVGGVGANSSMDFFAYPQKFFFKKNYLVFSDHFYSFIWKLKKTERRILLFLYRNSIGWSSWITKNPFSISYLCLKLQISERSVIDSLNSLIRNYGLSVFQSTPKGRFYNLKSLFVNNNLPTVDVPGFRVEHNVFDNVLYNTPQLLFDVFFYFYAESFSHGKNITHYELSPKLVSSTVNYSTKHISQAISELCRLSLLKRLNNNHIFHNKGDYYFVSSSQGHVTEPTNNEYFATETLSFDEATTYSNKSDNLFLNIKENPRTTTDISAPLNLSGDNNAPANSSTDDFSEKLSMDDSATIDKPLILHTSSADLSAPANLSDDKISDNKTINNNKTSSGDADDFFNLLKQQIPDGLNFLISRENVETYISEFGADTCKKNILRLKPRLSTAANPVGLWIDSLKNPQNYPELTQKTEMEKLAEQRLTDQLQKQEQLIREREELKSRVKIERVWTTLSDNEKETYLQESRASFGPSTEWFAIPHKAVLEKAMKMAFEEKKAL